MFLELEDHQLLQEAITHHKLLRGTRDVTVVVEESHAWETGDVHLKGNVASHVDVSLSLLSSENTVSSEVVKASVSDFIDHFIINYYILLL